MQSYLSDLLVCPLHQIEVPKNDGYHLNIWLVTADLKSAITSCKQSPLVCVRVTGLSARFNRPWAYGTNRSKSMRFHSGVVSYTVNGIGFHSFLERDGALDFLQSG